MEKKIIYNDILRAVKCWLCKTDGFNGANGGIYAVLPWDGVCLSCENWNRFEPRLSNVIPDCSKIGINVTKIVCGDIDELDKLNSVSHKITKDIINEYNKIVDEINSNQKKKFSVEVAETNHWWCCVMAENEDEARKYVVEHWGSGDIVVEKDCIFSNRTDVNVVSVKGI